MYTHVIQYLNITTPSSSSRLTGGAKTQSLDRDTSLCACASVARRRMEARLQAVGCTGGAYEAPLSSSRRATRHLNMDRVRSDQIRSDQSAAFPCVSCCITSYTSIRKTIKACYLLFTTLSANNG